MSEAVIVTMAPGERPTEPGWYVVQDAGGDRQIVEVDVNHRGDIDVLVTGVEMWDSLASRLEDGDTFIARIYPERILSEPATA